MKKLRFLALFFIALFALSTPVYSQLSKLVGQWEVRANSGWIGSVVFTNSGSQGIFSADGSRSSVNNIKVISGKFSFNVLSRNFKFDSLRFAGTNQLSGFLYEGGANNTTRKFAVVLTRK